MRYINTETGEIIEVVTTTDLKRFRRTQQRLTRQSMPLRQMRRKHHQRARAHSWWLKLVNHLGPIVVFGSIAIALLLHK